jgi:hypothetical protein
MNRRGKPVSGCGTFQHRQRTRRLRRVSQGASMPSSTRGSPTRSDFERLKVEYQRLRREVDELMEFTREQRRELGNTVHPHC